MNRNPSPAKLEKSIEELYGRGTILGEDGTEFKILPMSLTPERGAFLRDVCRAERPQVTIEIGMAYGISTLFIVQTLLETGAASCKHTVMDPFQTTVFHDAGRRVIREAGVDRLIEFHQDSSEYVLPRLLREGRRFDLAFIDGNHRFDHVFVDLFYIDRLLKDSGMLVLDDCFLNSVHHVCRFAQTNYGYTPVAQHPATSTLLEDDVSPATWRPSMRAMRKPAERVERDKFHFVPFYPLPVSSTPTPISPAPTEPARDTAPKPPAAAPSPKAMANRLRHGALLALETGDHRAARAGFAGALRLDPFHLKTYLRLMRTFFPSSMISLFSSPARRRKTSTHA
jgi:predicted O-methyltransferase YrrM